MVRQRISQAEGRPNIVVPTIRDYDFFANFLETWKDEFAGCHLIVIEDRPVKKLQELIEQQAKANGYTCEVYDWHDIDEDLKDKAWIISRKTDCVRNYGYLMAYRNKPLFIVTLDDDLEPAQQGHIQEFYNNLFTPVEQDLGYFSTMNGILPRGKLLSKKPREVVVSHGGWLNVPDLDAATQIEYAGQYKSDVQDFYRGIVPAGSLYSMCGMNLAWKPKITKQMYFPLMGAKGGYPIDRCGDIWAGFYCKDYCDFYGMAHYTGTPFAIHNRASNPWTNKIKETNEKEMGEEFVKIFLENDKPKGKFKDYFTKLQKAYKIWGELIEDISSSQV